MRFNPLANSAPPKKEKRPKTTRHHHPYDNKERPVEKGSLALSSNLQCGDLVIGQSKLEVELNRAPRKVTN